MQEKVTIITPRLTLDSIGLEDCTSTYLAWLNDADTNQFLESCFFENTMPSLKKFVTTNIEDPSSLFLTIRIRENNKHIGNIKIAKIHSYHRTGEYGILMGDKMELGKGYAKEASIAIINHVFSKLHLEKVNLGVIEENKTAVKLYEKLGFKVEGVLRKNYFHIKSGLFFDELRMGLLKTECNFLA